MVGSNFSTQNSMQAGSHLDAADTPCPLWVDFMLFNCTVVVTQRIRISVVRFGTGWVSDRVQRCPGSPGWYVPCGRRRSFLTVSTSTLAHWGMIYRQGQPQEAFVTNACKYSENNLLLGTDKISNTRRKAEDSRSLSG